MNLPAGAQRPVPCRSERPVRSECGRFNPRINSGQPGSAAMTNVLRVVDDVVWTDLDDEVVILKLDTGIYFGLNQVGARIWTLIAAGRRREEILQSLATQYNVSRDQIERDFDELISDLSNEGLIKTAA